MDGMVYQCGISYVLCMKYVCVCVRQSIMYNTNVRSSCFVIFIYVRGTQSQEQNRRCINTNTFKALLFTSYFKKAVGSLSIEKDCGISSHLY
jgi:hypothetical protein